MNASTGVSLSALGAWWRTSAPGAQLILQPARLLSGRIQRLRKQIQSLIIKADILYKGAQYKAGRAAGKIQSAHDILAVCQSKTLHAFIKKANSSSPAVPGSTARTLNKIRILTEQR